VRSSAHMYITGLYLYTSFMSHYAASRAREVFSEVVDKSATEPVFIERRGEVAAVVISPSRYEQLLEALEEQEDEQAFDQALAEEGDNIPWEQVKADLGWQ
jgi:antitoxin Phd